MSPFQKLETTFVGRLSLAVLQRNKSVLAQDGLGRPSHIGVVACILLFAAPTFADNLPNTIVAQAQAKQPTKNENVISPEREAAVMTFVQLHHPELEALLDHLRDARPKEHEKALRELFRVTERLGQIQDRDKELYELELRQWKSQSRLQLLLARLQMHEDEDDLRKQIESAVKEQADAKIAMMERQERKLTEQAKKAQDDLKKFKAERNKWISRQVEMFTRPQPSTSESGNDDAEKKKPETKPTEKPKAPAGKPSGKEPDRQDDKPGNKPKPSDAKPKEGRDAKPGK